MLKTDCLAFVVARADVTSVGRPLGARGADRGAVLRAVAPPEM